MQARFENFPPEKLYYVERVMRSVYATDPLFEYRISSGDFLRTFRVTGRINVNNKRRSMKKIDPEEVARVINEVLIFFVNRECPGKEIPERQLRRLIDQLGFVPTDGLPIEKEIVEMMKGTGKYNKI